jgi:hypothetical protein
MGRIRTIKPEFFKHGDLFDAEKAEKLPLRIAFAGLWCQCDREGRFAWKPRELKLDILPYDDCDFSRVLDALCTRGFIVKYASEGKTYGCVPTFSSHQIVNNRESDSVLPAPNEINNIDASGTRESRDDHAAAGEGKGREGKGRRVTQVEIPEWLDSEDWVAFIEHRKRIRKPMTPHAEMLNLKELIQHYASGEDSLAVLRHTIAKGWQGFVWKDAPKRKIEYREATAADDLWADIGAVSA